MEGTACTVYVICPVAQASNPQSDDLPYHGRPVHYWLAAAVPSAALLVVNDLYFSLAVALLD
eukprot:1154691-Pelagomonas_calceolata.AAC.1